MYKDHTNISLGVDRSFGYFRSFYTGALTRTPSAAML